MKYLIIGDVHGCIDQLGRYVKYFDQVDKVIFVGDLVDRGDDSMACMKLAYSVKNGIILEGNHERKYYKRFKSGNVNYIPRDIDLHDKMKFWELLLNILHSSQVYYKDGNIFVSHAPYALWQHSNFNVDQLDHLVYGKKMTNDAGYVYDKDGYKVVMKPQDLYGDETSIMPVIYGHIHHPQFIIRDNEYCVDWDAGKDGPLAALLFENNKVISAFLDGHEVSINSSSL